MTKALRRPSQRRDGVSSIPFLALALAFFVLFAVSARAGEVFTGGPEGVAIRGFDPVAYFTEGRPVEGSPAFTHDWKGVTWRFSNAENRERFAADPERWAPKYGGYCAWAVSQGYSAPIDPRAWSVVDGALYLNYSRGVHARWSRDIPGHIARADENWPTIRSGLAD